MRRLFQVAPILLALSVGCEDKKDKPEADGKTDDAKKGEKKDGGDKDDAKKPAGGDAATASAAGAWERLPDDCQVAVSIDVKSLLSHAKVKSDIVPVLEAGIEAKKKDPEFKDAKQLEKFLADTKLNVNSIESVGVCVKSIPTGKPEFTVALAGALTKDTIVAAIQAGSTDEKDKADFKEVNGHPAVSDEKVTFYQLDDGTMVFGSSPEILTKVDAKNTNYSGKYKLDVGKFLAFSVSNDVVKMAPPLPNTPKSFTEIKTVAGTISLDPPEAKIVLDCGSDANATEIAAFVVAGKAMAAGAVGTDNTFGQKDAFDGIAAKAEGTNVVITVPIPVEKGIAAAAPMLKGVIGA